MICCKFFFLYINNTFKLSFLLFFQSLLSRQVTKILCILLSNAGGNNSNNTLVFLVGSGTEKAEIGN